MVIDDGGGGIFSSQEQMRRKMCCEDATCTALHAGGLRIDGGRSEGKEEGSKSRNRQMVAGEQGGGWGGLC